MSHSSTPQGTGPFIGMPPPLHPGITETKHWFQALDNFCRFMAIRQGDRVLMLTDPLLDPRVVDAFTGLAASRGATLTVYMAPDTKLPGIPENLKPLIQDATFVISTWFCSIEDPFNVAMRKAGQRWVKITYFRDLDLLKTPQARFPVELVSELIRATERRIPKGRDFDFRFTDGRGSDLRIPFTAAMRDAIYSSLRWQGKITASEPGCYAHYMPTHGPNFWDSTAMKNDGNAPLKADGVLYPQWAIGFTKPFEEKIAVVFKDKFVTEVRGESGEAGVLREMLMGGKLIEGGGCGFNPKAPRNTIYPAGSNAPGALHFGIDLAKPSDFIRRVMPTWEEPAVHQDLVVLDATVTAGDVTLIEQGFLMALRDPAVIELAARFGDPVDLLEGSV